MHKHKTIGADTERQSYYGIEVPDKSTSTYLYINGLEVLNEIDLSDGLSLMPVGSRSSFRKHVLRNPDIFDRAYSVLLEYNIRSQIKICGKDAKEVAIKAWNAQWDAALLSAVFNCCAVANIQGEAAIDEVDDHNQIHIIHPHLLGAGYPVFKPSNEDMMWVKKYYVNAKGLMKDRRYSHAVNSLSSYIWHMHPSVQLAILWSGIEALFGIRSELLFRLSFFIAKFLCGQDRDAAQVMYTKVKSLYADRSKAVHGDVIKDPSAVRNSAILLQLLIKKCAENCCLPDEDKLLFS